MIMSTLALMAYVKGNSSMLRRSDSDTSSVTGPRSVFWARVAAPSPGKCLQVKVTAAFWACSDGCDDSGGAQ
jgi:hypothetical protein